MDALTKRVVMSLILLFFIVCSYASPTQGQWSTCSVTCGDGTQTRTLLDGSTETRTCNLQSCSTPLTPLTDWRVLNCFSPCASGRMRALQVRECLASPCEAGALVRFIWMTCQECEADASRVHMNK
ncbi:A disintegrin and metalloproteinase with thrombospondin motifs adt-1-like isoform X2 [Lytechinus variegatus]|uniref:A disintegrin and metalloproteinase with thrombospondin motifs adt-1-like isoform X2 n=1 Tax=Lytechinus variegatus TaxID=7654 RepID=UPI001BB27234|nr:A disintegrin and metalloproteinase with thrombospondin motifs adt-1-like isoform X2 [Lytechinus variegatus]